MVLGLCVHVRSVESDSLQTHGLYSARFLCPLTLCPQSLARLLFPTQGLIPCLLHLLLEGRLFTNCATWEAPWAYDFIFIHFRILIYMAGRVVYPHTG